ncbi:hypothetical protein PanWU01x14_151870 [Parasponia andersonii]|uniref:DUF241 domain protein n=1 Tax=Parasponia andersonii TaxID=3476 RepID=A0A2P5CHW6_PARAD|nr:hypothetical protein PanWU01x14_151870 [Parasponia andersonii]
MATSFEVARNTCHARSKSLPSRSHPLVEGVEEQLSRLRTSSESTTSSSLCHRLSSLKDLHESLDNFLQLQHTKQALSREQNNKCVEQLLDGSLRLVDVCGTTRDVFSQMRECLQELQSTLRRKRGCESGLDNEISAYMFSKKILAKMTRNLKSNITKNHASGVLLNRDSDLFSVVTILNEFEEITSEVFQSLLAFISRPKTSSRSIVSKLFKFRKISCQGEGDATEIEKMDAELIVLKSSKDIKTEQVKQVLKGLESLESNIQELEEELECMFRHLMKTRVSLLNIFNN